MNLLAISEVPIIVPIFLVAFVAIAISIISAARNDAQRKHQAQQQRAQALRNQLQQEENMSEEQRRIKYAEHLRTKYAQQLRTKGQQQTSQTPPQEKTHTHVAGGIAANSDGHVHIGQKEEYYDDIVGSLGEGSTEGCEDLRGVRLISHDVAYEVEHISRDYSQIAKAMVLGEVLDNPRFKNKYHK